MKKRIIKEYENCLRCKGTGIIIGKSFGGIREVCNICKGKGRVVKKEEIIEE